MTRVGSKLPGQQQQADLDRGDHDHINSASGLTHCVTGRGSLEQRQLAVDPLLCCFYLQELFYLEEQPKAGEGEGRRLDVENGEIEISNFQTKLFGILWKLKVTFFFDHNLCCLSFDKESRLNIVVA